MARPVELSWKNTRMKVDIGTYDGDGATNGRTINIGFTPGLVVIIVGSASNAAITSNTSNYLHLDSQSVLTEAAERTDVHIDTNGFTVGDGNDRLNDATGEYIYLAFGLAGTAQISWKDVRETIEFGQYVGDGVTTGREINTGFQADLAFIQTDDSANFWYSMNGTTSAQAAPGLGTVFSDQTDVHTSANGFTVGDGGNTANQSDVTYNYVAINLDGQIQVSWKNDRLRTEAGTYTGDGTTDGSNTVDMGFAPDWVFIQEDNDPRSWVLKSVSEQVALQLAPGLSNNVQSTNAVQGTATGFLVGSGSATANTNSVTYNYFATGIE